jgi:hypothetical protein
MKQTTANFLQPGEIFLPLGLTPDFLWLFGVEGVASASRRWNNFTT